MNKFFIIPVVVIIGIIISVSLVFETDTSFESQSSSIYETGFTYYDIEIIQSILAEENIVVSTPTAITDHTINQYCTFFEKGLPRSVEYCTTTAVFDSEGNSFGNINIGGDTQSPVLAIANLETFDLDSNQDEVFLIFETVIETLVCDCWDEQDTAEYESISSWLEAVQTFSSDSEGRNIKSKIDNLDNHEISLEITTKDDDSILQTLIILK